MEKAPGQEKKIKKTGKVTRIFQGLSINAGKVLAPTCLFSAERHQAVITYQLRSKRDVSEEIKRFDDALKACSKELDAVAKNVSGRVGKTEAEIFTTQKHIMNDPAIVEDIHKRIEQDRKNAERAIAETFISYEDKFRKLENPYLRERAADIAEMRKRLLDHLKKTKPGFICKGQAHCAKGKNRVIVAEELTVSMVAQMDFEKVKGFITEHGGVTSHAAIIARSLGVPAVSGIPDIMGQIRCSDKILVDGDNGRVYLDPDKETVNTLIRSEEKIQKATKIVPLPAGIQVMANAGFLEDVKTAKSVGADGIGLFRTEVLFMTAERLLNEEEQFEHYARVMKQMDGKPVTFRLLDVGGDKALPFLRIEKEANPYLGWRGARFLLSNSDIFTPQIRALARLSRIGPVRILFPMIIDAEQQKQLIAAVREAVVSTDADSANIKLGAMFEVPSACLQAKGIYKLVDFASIGSNDLIQYLFAVDRNNERVSHCYDPEHDVLWDLLKNLADTAKAARKPLSICGEMAAQKGVGTRLIQAGIPSLSVSPRLVPRVRGELADFLK